MNEKLYAHDYWTSGEDPYTPDVFELEDQRVQLEQDALDLEEPETEQTHVPEPDGISTGLHWSNLFDQYEDESGEKIDLATGEPYSNNIDDELGLDHMSIVTEVEQLED